MRNVVAVIVSVAMLSGCGGGDGGGGPGTSRTVSCTFPSDRCQALTAVLTDAQQGELQAGCGADGGAFFAGPCGTAGMLAGHCHYASLQVGGQGWSTTGSLDEYYDATTWVALDAQAYCAAPPAGTWVP